MNRRQTIPAATFTPVVSQTTGLLLQRKCGGCGTHTVAGGGCAACEKKKSLVQRRAARLDGVNEVPAIVQEVLNSPGQPLDTATRAFMEPRFHHDFSKVRVHTDAKAAASARAVNANAYTVGPQIVFDSGQYLPQTTSGKNLLAHELTHVLQQSTGLARSGGNVIGPTNDEHEQQADAVAQAIVGIPGKTIPNHNWARTSPFHQVRVGSEVPPAPGRRLQRRSKADEDFFDQPLTGETAEPVGGGEAPENKFTCPRTPTLLGDEVPKPPCPKATHTGTTELDRFNFCLDSDQLTDPGQLNGIAATVNGVHSSTHFLVHGYASPEGKVDYNFRLACHRAIKIANAFKEAVRARLQKERKTSAKLQTEVDSRVETASQGPTSEHGKAEANRVAIVYGQIPGRDEPEPGCDDAPRKIGDIKPEVNCDVPTKDLLHMTGGQQLTHFHFCLDSDVLAATNPTSIRNFAHRQAANAVFFVHGFSSVEGATDSNERLSCHRALRIFRELINAGVKAEQIKEVSGRGETNEFGEPEFNRVAIVFAEGGKISDLPGGKRQADTREAKLAVRDEAVKRINSGQYNLGADAYISTWTCGRTSTVRQGLERLTIEVKADDANEILRDQADGTEEGFGVNFVTLSNVALRADNAIECTMGRLIDMTFHHAVLGNPDLAENLVGDKAARHKAGLHLIHLAGLSACTGNRTKAEVKRNEPIGISEPETDDPQVVPNIIPLPPCTEAPQPTRLHPPVAGGKGREAPTFEVIGKPIYTPARGKLLTDFEKTEKNRSRNRLITKPDGSMFTASAEVQLKGKPDTFADYEVGFIQTVLDEETQADYDSGHHVIQKLPAPIRLAAMKNKPFVPAPWTTADSMQRPGNDGKVSVNATGSGLNTETAIGLRQLKGTLPNSAMHEFEENAAIAIWLIARRLGAPLDRFSVHFLDGVTYNLLQTCHLEHRRRAGELKKEGVLADFQEQELSVFKGSFLTSKPSELPADPSVAKFTGPIASEINLFNQVRNIVEPDAATEAGMGIPELTRVVADILDNLVIFKDDEDAKKGVSGTRMPRLGFDFIPLTFTIPFVRRTGRMRDPEGEEILTKATGPGLGSDAAFHLAKALEFRIKDRNSEGQGVVLKPSVIKGSGEFGEVVVKLDPIQKQPGSNPDQDSDLIKRPDVLKDMAEAWACTLATKNEKLVGRDFGVREFGRSYAMDRNKVLQQDPPDRLKMGCPEELGVGTRMNLPCPRPSDGVTLGGFHTHPEPEIPPRPTAKEDENAQDDFDFARECGSQAFIVTDFKAFRYFANGDVGPAISLPRTNECPRKNIQVEDEKCKRAGDGEDQ
ncbi:MAG: DUF4157 domain-containing protein [Acidobacteriota bacterium]